MSSLTLKTLSILRMLVGSSTLLLPRQIAPVFGIPISPEATIIARLFGIRDFVLGAYLWKVVRDWDATRGNGGHTVTSNLPTDIQQRPLIPKGSTATIGQADKITGSSLLESTDPSAQIQTITTIRRNNLCTALWLGLACDGVDVASSIVCTIEGNLSDMAKIGVGAGAALFSAIAAQQLRRLKREVEAEET